MSKIIVIEGPDRCGKATQSRLLCDYLNDRGLKAKVVEVPIDDTYTYPIIYWMLRNGLAKKLPNLFQWIQVINRWLFQTHRLVTLEHEYDYIIFDRWSLSSAVYGVAAGLSPSDVESSMTLLRSPDFTFVLLGKSHSHVAEDVYESDVDLQTRVRTLYAAWVNHNPKKAHAVDSERSRERVHDEIVSVLKIMRIIPM